MEDSLVINAERLSVAEIGDHDGMDVATVVRRTAAYAIGAVAA
jgi:hypothetical protein